MTDDVARHVMARHWNAFRVMRRAIKREEKSGSRDESCAVCTKVQVIAIQFSPTDVIQGGREVGRNGAELKTRLKQMQYCRMHLDRLHLHSRDASRSGAGSRTSCISRPPAASLTTANGATQAACVAAPMDARLSTSDSLNAWAFNS